MYSIVLNNSRLVIKLKTLSAARDYLADIRKAALKSGRLASYDGQDCLNLGTLGSREIEVTYTILEG